jgi:hypothetical protein
VYNIYCSAHHDQCSLIILSFWLHGVVGADLRPDSMVNSSCTLLHVASYERKWQGSQILRVGAYDGKSQEGLETFRPTRSSLGVILVSLLAI